MALPEGVIRGFMGLTFSSTVVADEEYVHPARIVSLYLIRTS